MFFFYSGDQGRGGWRGAMVAWIHRELAFMEAQHQFVARFLYSDLNCSEKTLLQDPKTKIQK
jgi:hypothetical protein